MKLFFVFPFTSSFPDIEPDMEFSLTKFEATSPKKMFSKLIVELIKDKIFLPILSIDLINNIKR